MDFEELKWLKEEIKLSGYSRTEIAVKLGISYPLLLKYLNGTMEMPLEIRGELGWILFESHLNDHA